MFNNMSIAGIESDLMYARSRHENARHQLFSVTFEIECLEIALRNAKRNPEDPRPFESAGDPMCSPHEWQGDEMNDQMFCKCGARLDLILGGRYPTFDPDTAPDEKVFEQQQGWESVRCGGFGATETEAAAT